jgi:hypothetical protein
MIPTLPAALIPYLWRGLAIFGILLACYITVKVHDNNIVKATQAKEQIAAIKAVATAQSDSDKKWGPVANKLTQVEAKLHQVEKEKESAIQKFLNNTLCLSPDALRVFNSNANSSGDLSKAANGTPTESPGGIAASDRDIARWGGEAKTNYTICAKRLNALIDFSTSH